MVMAERMARIAPPNATTLISCPSSNWLPKLDDESSTGVMAIPSRIMVICRPDAVPGLVSVLRMMLFLA
ncbi:hypothetical protein D3C77_450160 [compost metagenome]